MTKARGELDFSGGRVLAQRARRSFWDAVTQRAPQVWSDLATAPGAQYLAILRQWPAADQLDLRPVDMTADEDPPWRLRSWNDPTAPASDFALLHEAIIAWGERWKLTDPWCIQQGLNTLWLWQQEGKLARMGATPPPPRGAATASHRQWQHLLDLRWTQGRGEVHIAPVGETWPRFEFHRSWSPRRAARADDYRTALAEFRKQYTAYQHQVAAVARDRGATSMASKREPDHFAWLVCYQVLDDSFSGLGTELSKDPKTIEDGVKRAARLIGLTLRQARRGAPRGTPHKKRVFY